MNKNIAFIGCGNIGSALIGGILKSGLAKPDMIITSDPALNKLKKINERYGIYTTKDNKKAAEFADITIIAVKPDMYFKIIDDIREAVKENSTIVTIAPGIKIADVEEAFNRNIKVIRTMPNTPALVGEGMTAICCGENVEKEAIDDVVEIFKSCGSVEFLDESMMDVVTAVSSSSPAFTYMFVEALASGGVLKGMKWEVAYRMAAQAVLGSAKMILETEKHPSQLKDEVCSPGGTTIEAVYFLDKNNFRGTVMQAVEGCYEKSKKLGKRNKNNKDTNHEK